MGALTLWPCGQAKSWLPVPETKTYGTSSKKWARKTMVFFRNGLVPRMCMRVVSFWGCVNRKRWTLDPSITLLGLEIFTVKYFSNLMACHTFPRQKKTKKRREVVNPHWLQERLQYPWPWIWGLKKHNGFLVAADVKEWSFDEWTKFEGIFGSFWNYGRFFWVSMLVYFGPLLVC